MNPTVFLGLVTHQRTRFPEASGPGGLVHRLADQLGAIGVTATVSIHDEDHYSPSLVPLTRAKVTASIDAELALEKQWRIYVDPAVAGPRLDATTELRRLYRRARLAPPSRSGSPASHAGGRMLRRLVNIECAHVHLMKRALQSGSAWALIVEDDAQLDDAAGFAEALVQFMNGRSPDRQPAYVNVSRSFDHLELGVSDHLSYVGQWSSTVRELAADRPLTNTVCAILYRSTFLEELTRRLDAIPVDPVVPIDWKVNSALMRLSRDGTLVAEDCWFLEPAPIIQGSMTPSDVPA